MHSPYWDLVTRLGEMQLLVPAALVAIWRMTRVDHAQPQAIWWLVSLALAALITTATKIVFIGWGIGLAQFNFTGISGHAMFAAAIYPMLLGAIASHFHRVAQQSAIAAGIGMAVLVGVSRVIVDAHSTSEVVTGLALGLCVSISATVVHALPRAVLGLRLTVVLTAWLLIGVLMAPTSPTHDLVTRTALALSGHAAPFSREDLVKKLSPK